MVTSVVQDPQTSGLSQIQSNLSHLNHKNIQLLSTLRANLTLFDVFCFSL